VEKEKWVVCSDYEFYPEVYEFENEKLAIEKYRELIKDKTPNENLYICKVLEMLKSHDE
jgi:hypothetical protein